MRFASMRFLKGKMLEGDEVPGCDDASYKPSGGISFSMYITIFAFYRLLPSRAAAFYIYIEEAIR